MAYTAADHLLTLDSTSEKDVEFVAPCCFHCGTEYDLSTHRPKIIIACAHTWCRKCLADNEMKCLFRCVEKELTTDAPKVQDNYAKLRMMERKHKQSDAMAQHKPAESSAVKEALRKAKLKARQLRRMEHEWYTRSLGEDLDAEIEKLNQLFNALMTQLHLRHASLLKKLLLEKESRRVMFLDSALRLNQSRSCISETVLCLQKEPEDPQLQRQLELVMPSILWNKVPWVPGSSSRVHVTDEDGATMSHLHALFKVSQGHGPSSCLIDKVRVDPTLTWLQATVLVRDSSGTDIKTGGDYVRAVLTTSDMKKLIPETLVQITDFCDGTYIIRAPVASFWPYRSIWLHLFVNNVSVQGKMFLVACDSFRIPPHLPSSGHAKLSAEGFSAACKSQDGLCLALGKDQVLTGDLTQKVWRLHVDMSFPNSYMELGVCNKAMTILWTFTLTGEQHPRKAKRDLALVRGQPLTMWFDTVSDAKSDGLVMYVHIPGCVPAEFHVINPPTEDSWQMIIRAERCSVSLM